MICIDTPYIDPGKLFSTKKSDCHDLFIGDKSFWAYYPNTKVSKYIENYVTRDPSLPISDYKFREFNHKKWLYGSFK